MKNQKFLLILATVFCILFILTFLHDVRISAELQRSKKLIKAYELYASDSKDFSKFVEDNKLSELNILLQKQLQSQVRSKIDAAKTAYRNGNFADAASFLREIKDIENPWLDEVYFYLGMSLYKIGEIESSKIFLAAFLDGFRYSIYRKEALLVLRELSTGDFKKKVEDAINNLDKER
ncbi:tetratricopeptide repeat protein [Fervidobacterium sp.]